MDTPDLREKVESFREKEPRELLHDSRYGLLLSAVFAFALWIRMIPENGMQYLQALDPYMIARLSEAIVSEGQLPLIDAWRYFPYLTPTFQLNLGDIVIPAYLYHLASPFMDFMTWAQVYPALSGAMMVLAMYFIGKELFGKQAGILAAFFLATAPAVLHRSSAGWFEKEPFAAFLMFTSIYFFTRAWKRKEWFSGMAAGTALGIALTVWGGAKFLVLLYPLIVFPVAFIDEDIENLLIAFTPTLILGHFIAAIFNPSRWSVPNGGLVVGLGVLGMIWIRYYVEEYEVLEEGQLKYVVPGLTGIGGLLGFLSPLYSQRLAGYVMSFVSKASQGSADVVGGTVAENQAAQAGQIIGQIGAFRSQQVLPSGIASVSEFFSGWTFSLIGTSLLIAVIAGMLIKKYSSKDSFVPRAGYVAFAISFMVLSASLVLMLIKPQTLESVVAAFLFSTVVALVGTVFFLLFPSEEISPDERWYL
ncbi:MAG: glycosyltransferase family 39 protein, partial [Candidatus Nanohaloarchaeota archaeon QJJ-7]|nr:glycosyltransferase family 39 protein [Candidatus Nanohaloarchaeota archaeon QJJ-7]